MGLFDYFRRRRERESALPPGALEELRVEAAPPEPEAPEDPPAAELPGSDAVGLGELIRRAAKTGLPQVTTESHTADPPANELPDVIRGLLGHDPEPDRRIRTLDPDELRALRDRVREQLRDEGIDPDTGRPL